MELVSPPKRESLPIMLQLHVRRLDALRYFHRHASLLTLSIVANFQIGGVYKLSNYDP